MGDRIATAAAPRIRTPDQRVRVFISSTLGELATERRAARDAVEQLRLTPIMFELGARPHPPRALYRSYLEQSDVFVGIYWQRYGWVAPDMDISGLQDELVLSTGMPRLIYVKRPAPEMEPRLEEMLHGLEGDDGPSYKPFADASELHELLVDDLALLLTERFQEGREQTPAIRASRSNLPAMTTSFVGRERELSELHTLLAEDRIRLLTLVGAGGTGKTRLAIEAARAEVPRFDDGVCFVGLATEREPDDAFAAISRALEVEGPVGDTPWEWVVHELAARELLLVLDNVEQIAELGPGLVELLERCPQIKILVTSRETLRVTPEHVVAVPVLSVPPGDPSVSMDAVVHSEAGRLFLERAKAVGSPFTPSGEDAEDIAAICRRLDGLPLAIELAAARVKLFSIHELRERLDARLDLLAGGGHDRPMRQRTLHDAIEWSDELLSSDERIVFRLFSVFSGARLDDVEQTLRQVPATADLDVVETLSSLVDKSLLRVVLGTDRRPRFSMLRTIREYAGEQLADDAELGASMRAAHADHYVRVAVDLQGQLTDAGRAAVLAALRTELENLRTAWQYLVERGDVEQLDDLLAPLWGYYEARGDYRAAIVLGEELLRTLAALPESPGRTHDELALRANLARTQLVVRGFSPEAEQAVVQALARFEHNPETSQRFPALRSLASLQLWRSDFAAGSASSRELMAIAQQEQDPALLVEAHLTRCISTTWRDDIPAAVDDADKAVAYFEATTSGFVEFRVGPNPGVVAKAIGGLLRWTAGLPDAATASMRAALDLAEELDHPYSRAFALHHAALLDLWRQEPDAVLVHADESRRLAEAHDYAVWKALALVLEGAATVGVGRSEVGLAEMERGFALYQQLTTPPIFWPAAVTIRATAHGAAGESRRALELIEDAWSSLGDHPVAAEIAIAHGDLLLSAPEPARDVPAAVRLFERAAALSAQRRARMIELQSLTRLVALDEGTTAGDEARRRLRALYAWFSEGFDTVDLRAASAVLGEGP